MSIRRDGVAVNVVNLLLLFHNFAGKQREKLHNLGHSFFGLSGDGNIDKKNQNNTHTHTHIYN